MKNPFDKIVGKIVKNAKKLKQGEKFSFYIGYDEFFSVDTDEYPLDRIWYLENEIKLLRYILQEAENEKEDPLEYFHDSLVCSLLEAGFEIDFLPNYSRHFSKAMHGAYQIWQV